MAFCFSHQFLHHLRTSFAHTYVRREHHESRRDLRIFSWNPERPVFGNSSRFDYVVEIAHMHWQFDEIFGSYTFDASDGVTRFDAILQNGHRLDDAT